MVMIRKNKSFHSSTPSHSIPLPPSHSFPPSLTLAHAPWDLALKTGCSMMGQLQFLAGIIAVWKCTKNPKYYLESNYNGKLTQDPTLLSLLPQFDPVAIQT